MVGLLALARRGRADLRRALLVRLRLLAVALHLARPLGDELLVVLPAAIHEERERQQREYYEDDDHGCHGSPSLWKGPYPGLAGLTRLHPQQARGQLRHPPVPASEERHE